MIFFPTLEALPKFLGTINHKNEIILLASSLRLPNNVPTSPFSASECYFFSQMPHSIATPHQHFNVFNGIINVYYVFRRV